MNAEFIEPPLEPQGPDCPACGSAWFYAVHHEITGEFLGYECGNCGHETETLTPSHPLCTGASHDD